MMLWLGVGVRSASERRDLRMRWVRAWVWFAFKRVKMKLWQVSARESEVVSWGW